MRGLFYWKSLIHLEFLKHLYPLVNLLFAMFLHARLIKLSWEIHDIYVDDYSGLYGLFYAGWFLDD